MGDQLSKSVAYQTGNLAGHWPAIIYDKSVSFRIFGVQNREGYYIHSDHYLSVTIHSI